MMAPVSDVEKAAERNFYHPFKPYDIQKQFMSALYQCIEDGNIGIFESPTGTGKSLSLICGSLTWLRDHKRKAFEEGLTKSGTDGDEPEWMREHAQRERRSKALRNREELEARLAKIRSREKRMRERQRNGEPKHKRAKTAADMQASDDDEEARFVLDDYESDDDAGRKAGVPTASDYGLSAETRALMSKLGMSVGGTTAEEELEAVDELKIFYCSRTHSQLAQFANELRRVKLPPAIPAEPLPDITEENSGEREIAEELKHLTLGSRKNLCINPKVSKLGSATAINERCLELQQSGVAADCKCQFLPTKDTEAVVNDFRDHALASIRDIEDLGVLGKQLGICPYYASRPAVKPAEIVTLPYPLLLQKSAREALNLSLKDHVIIIDEAHNLMDAITGIYSISVSLTQFQRSRAQLGIYLQKFRNRLKGKNRVYVAQTVRLLDSLTSYLQDKSSGDEENEGVVHVGDLMAGKGVDQINLYKLMRYLQESKLARKVDGYTVHTEQQGRENEAHTSKPVKPKTPQAEKSIPVLTHIQGFLLALMNPSAEGRFLFTRTDDGATLLRYMLLDPANHFKEIVDDARAVILAGGTMSPMSDYTQHLFPYLPASRIVTLSCGHVIPPSNLLAWPVTTAASGAPFDFTFEKRAGAAMMRDLGAALLSFARAIPDGVVVFFPSHAYLDQCVAAWRKEAGAPGSRTLWAALADVKPVFLESRSTAPASAAAAATTTTTPSAGPPSSTAASTLAAYTSAISAARPPRRGALLLAVTGGTLSEGINFSDALGRGVGVVGLPFADARSAEWRARAAHAAATAATPALGRAAARARYENAAMRAVNQCVGRAIRHRGDYAAILLLDRRYADQRVAGKLPGWIRESLRGAAGVGEVAEGLGEFFRGKEGV